MIHSFILSVNFHCRLHKRICGLEMHPDRVRPRLKREWRRQIQHERLQRISSRCNAIGDEINGFRIECDLKIEKLCHEKLTDAFVKPKGFRDTEGKLALKKDSPARSRGANREAPARRIKPRQIQNMLRSNLARIFECSA